uniref:NADH dehydrogenase subunit 6 n=1 Tax=Xystodesmus sp. YD-2016 TaxID=1904352 RepID=A0A1S5RS92_9MYRI|nr:NADH dehydrogenase subunit 6 [Xystodesmus sp. YD-2016]
MMMLFIFMSLIVSFSFSQVMSPMVLALLVVGMGVLVMFNLGLMLPLFWFSYIILLTFLGGLLIIFVYMASLCPNEPIININWLGLFGGVGLMWIQYEWWSMGDLLFMGSLSEVSVLLKMYFSGMISLVCLLVIYLLIVLLVVVDLSLFSEGSLKVK